MYGWKGTPTYDRARERRRVGVRIVPLGRKIMETTYTASKTRSSRPGWSVIFRHPLRRDGRGRLGLKVRRGLGTADEAIADQLVGQLNELLHDEKWWGPDRKADAAQIFSPVVVSAFFDGIEIGKAENSSARPYLVPLPGPAEDYSRVLLVGTTGAGKTTLLRHLIGSSHSRDKFPATSTARTTTADIEIITREGPFEAVVTFLSEFETRAYIDESIEAACVAAVDGQRDEAIARAFLEHRDQRFRLFYILGEWPETEPDAVEEGFDFEGTAVAPNAANDELLVGLESSTLSARLKEYVGRIKRVAETVGSTANIKHTRPTKSASSQDDRAQWLQTFVEALHENDEFSRIGLDIKDDIEDRFAAIDEGTIERTTTGWPEVWRFTTPFREILIRSVRRFSSNYYGYFGKLVTPLVEGIRVQGPFEPLLPELRLANKLVLIDGQGLGHTGESATSISTLITKRFTDVDVILLIDSAQQPMQAAPIALLRAASVGGHIHKLAIAFTHFDEVKGDNLRTLPQKKAHVLSSLNNAITSLRETIGEGNALAIRRRTQDRTFLLGGLDREIHSIPPGVVGEISRLLTVFREAASSTSENLAAPRYSVRGLETALLTGLENFRRPWEARLNLTYADGIKAEHWTRIKALSRRFTNGRDEYDGLRPAADLISRVQEQISKWLEHPVDWTSEPKNAADREVAIDNLRQAIFKRLHILVKQRLGDEQRVEWGRAYNESGPGSATDRALRIRRIYNSAAPERGPQSITLATNFYEEVVGLVRKSIEENGGVLKL